MPENLKKIDRLIRLITLIHGRGDLTAGKLAEQFKVTERTIFRDLKTLERAGVPVSFNPDANGYEIRRDFFLPPVQMTVDEALAICVLGEQVGRSEQVPFLAVAERAVEKIRGQLPAPIRQELAGIEKQISIHLAASSHAGEAHDVYATVRDAIAKKRQLQCSYDSATASAGKPTRSDKPFKLKPYALLFGQRAWYVVGHHSRHDAIRCLRLSRFTRCQPTDTPYAIPDDFDLGKYLGNAWRMIRGEKRHKVEIVFDKQFADGIGETQWHATQEVEELDDGSIRFTCTVDGLDEIVWWVLGMGPHCRVVSPKELVGRVRELAEQTVRQYGETKGRG
jgi:proteasome accessory factor B